MPSALDARGAWQTIRIDGRLTYSASFRAIFIEPPMDSTEVDMAMEEKSCELGEGSDEDGQFRANLGSPQGVRKGKVLCVYGREENHAVRHDDKTLVVDSHHAEVSPPSAPKAEGWRWSPSSQESEGKLAKVRSGGCREAPRSRQ